MTFLFALAALGLFLGNVLSWIILVSLAVTAVNFMLGDILILPSFGNVVSAVADGLVAMLVAHVSGVLIFGFRTSGFSLLLFGTLVAIGEYLLHSYFLNKKDAR
jgi:hypothetical protein